MPNNKIRGFTLIEIMIVVALIAILASIAMPAYNNYINRGRLKTVQADLVALSLNFENYYRGKLSYPAAAKDQATLKTEFKGWRPASDSASFTFSSAASTGGVGYSLSAAAAATSGLSGCTVVFKSDGDCKINGDSCSYKGNCI